MFVSLSLLGINGPDISLSKQEVNGKKKKKKKKCVRLISM
jgi:hypothetical protein